MHQRPASRLFFLSRARLALAFAAVWALGAASPSRGAAATFTVEPTQIFLSERTTSVVMTLRNDSQETLRFELSAFKWTQSPTGELQVEPTEDVVFFPALLTLGPGESRRVRVGNATKLDVREKTYRIFVEELPPLTRQTGGVRVLTKMGIPIFLRPAKESASATLRDLRQQNGRLRFTLANDGTVHFVPKDILVRGLADSTTAFENRLDGWYVLAGGRREFEMAFPDAECSRVTSVVVDVQFGSVNLQERLQTPNGVCAR